MTQPIAVRRAFARNVLLSCCDPGAVTCAARRHGKGEAVYNRLEGASAVGLIAQGRVQVYSTRAGANLSTLLPGDCFGIATLFTGEPLTTRLICDRPALIAYIGGEHFLRLMEKYPEMYFRYARLCNEKLAFLTQKLELLTLPTCRARLLSYLQKHADEDAVLLEVSKERLARVLGVSRVSLFRELRQLTEAGMIAVDGRAIRLLRPDLLKGLLHQEL